MESCAIIAEIYEKAQREREASTITADGLSRLNPVMVYQSIDASFAAFMRNLYDIICSTILKYFIVKGSRENKYLTDLLATSDEPQISILDELVRMWSTEHGGPFVILFLCLNVAFLFCMLVATWIVILEGMGFKEYLQEYDESDEDDGI